MARNTGGRGRREWFTCLKSGCWHHEKPGRSPFVYKLSWWYPSPGLLRKAQLTPWRHSFPSALGLMVKRYPTPRGKMGRIWLTNPPQAHLFFLRYIMNRDKYCNIWYMVYLSINGDLIFDLQNIGILILCVPNQRMAKVGKDHAMWSVLLLPCGYRGLTLAALQNTHAECLATLTYILWESWLYVIYKFFGSITFNGASWGVYVISRQCKSSFFRGESQTGMV